MAEEYIEKEDDDDEEGFAKDKKSSSFLSVWMEKFFAEMLRLLVFSLVAFAIAFFLIQRDKDTVDEKDFDRIDRQFENIPAPRPLGAEWAMDEMIVNTSDELANHFVKISLVVSYDLTNPDISPVLSARKSEIHSEVRRTIGSKFYVDLKSVEKQALLAEELKMRLQRIVGMPGILEVYIIDFTVH